MAKMNIKKLAAEHAEKGVFGLFALIVLVALAGTSWTPYQGSPREITERVNSGKKKLKENVWPEEEVQKYTISRESAPANLVDERLRKEFNPAQVEVSGRLMVDPFGHSEPVREPVLLAPQDPIVSSSRVFVHLYDESLHPTQTPEQMLADKPKDDDSDLPDELRRNANATGGLDGMGMPGMQYGSIVQFESMAPGMMDPGMMPGMEGMAGGTAKPAEIKAEGYHFVSVRAVFPLRNQITQYADAIHKSFHYAAATFDIRNFHLERQTAQPGQDPWSGTWEAVDLKVAEDILMKAEGFDAEVVNPMITNAVITMPLPMRVSGRWDRQATHPRIEKFTLSDSEIAREADMQQKLLKEAVSQQKQMDANVVKRGGFSKLVIDPRQLNQDVIGGMGMFQGGGMPGMGMPGMGMGMEGMAGSGGGGAANMRGPGSRVDPLQKLIEDMARGSTNQKEEQERIRSWIQSLVSAEGELLLFRYLDFNVEPGKTYRYRVRFVLANPNYGKRIADAGGMNDVVEGETRETPWSEITRPVTVDNDVKYYLTEIREQSGRVLPLVQFDIFEWAQQHGTFINGILESRFGQQLIQEKETIVINPAKFLNEKQKFEFKSTDYVVDALEDIRIDEAFHEKSDEATRIKFPVGTRGKMPAAPKVIVANMQRDLKYMSPPLVLREHLAQKEYMKQQEKAYEYLKQPEVNEADMAMMDLGLEGAVPPEGRGKKRGPKNSMQVRKGGRGGSAASAGSMP